MRVLFCGSRNWINRDPIYKELSKLDPATTTIVHGAAEGADLIAGYLAKSFHFQIEEYPVTRAEWDRLGAAAGPLRNQKMIDTGIDLVIAFHKAGSRGTASTIRFAEKACIDTKIYDNEYGPPKFFEWSKLKKETI